MPKATSPRGTLQNIDKCYIQIPNFGKITLNNLPEIGDSKSAVYDSTSIIGRSSPLHTYHYSDSRNINIQFHFYIVEDGDAEKNLRYLRALQSCSYPRSGGGGAPFKPPPICRIKCGQLLAADQDLCVVMQQYSVRWPNDVAWDKETLCPYKFDVDTNWMVVYTSPDLPDQERIVTSGR